MSDHPIQGLMKTAMESLHGMVDVNTVIGDPVETPDGSVIVPVSRVAFGFAAGGGEYTRPGVPRNLERENDDVFPFGGGSGAGVSVQPVGFLVVGHGQVRMLPVQGTQPLDRLIDMAPQLFDKLKAMAQNDQKLDHSMASDREDHRTTMQ
jgi:sporulation protein YtfJ